MSPAHSTACEIAKFWRDWEWLIPSSRSAPPIWAVRMDGRFACISRHWLAIRECRELAPNRSSVIITACHKAALHDRQS